MVPLLWLVPEFIEAPNYGLGYAEPVALRVRPSKNKEIAAPQKTGELRLVYVCVCRNKEFLLSRQRRAVSVTAR